MDLTRYFITTTDISQALPASYDATLVIGGAPFLGLAMVHGIIQRFGGAVTVRSDPDAGTVFDIFLPLFEASAAHDDAVAA